MKTRLLCAAIILAVAALAGRFVFEARASASDFSISALDCSNQPGHITIQNNSASSSTLDQLAVVITPSTGAPIVIIGRITPIANYQVPAGGTVDLQVGQGATQSPNPAVPPAAPTSVSLTSSNLLKPGVSVQLVDNSTTPPTPVSVIVTCPPTAQPVLRVSPNGFDVIDRAGTPNSTCGADLPANTPPTPLNPGPCLTIENALRFANDGDTIFVEFGYYEVCRTIEINKLVRITTRGSALKGQTSFGATVAPGDTISPAVLHSFTGDSIFHITVSGFPSFTNPNNFPNNVADNFAPFTRLFFVNHAAIDGLRLGGAFKPGAAAIVLDNDAYTDVSNNFIGGEPLTNPFFSGVPCLQPQPFPPNPPNPGFNPPRVLKSEVMGNANGIILSNSTHANIFNNVVVGSSDFKYSPTLAIGDVQSGFGIITAECLGNGPDASDGATIGFNTISHHVNAGIWLCSDGSGGHLIGNDTIRSNGRGVVLRAITGTLLDSDIISDSYQDGVVIYDASSGNTIQKSVIESQRTPGAAGIRLGGFGGSLFPMQTGINNNTIRRNATALVIAGARSTVAIGNFITAEDTRTAVLLQTGSPGSPNVTQPTGTVLNLNQVLFNGSCGATQGCAIRLDKFVTADVDATANSFGLSVRTDVNSVMWHKPNDPTLGFISASQPNAVPVFATQTPAPGAPGAPGAANEITRGSGYVTPAPAPPTPAPPAGPVAPPQNLGAGPAASAAFAQPGAAAPAAASTPVNPGAAASATPVRNPTATPSVASGPGTGASGSTTASPVLGQGPAGGTTTYTPPCTLITVPPTIGISITAGKFLSMFQPSANIFSAWKFNNSTHAFQSIYFADTTVPVDAAALRPGDIISLCLSDNVQGPP